MPSIPNAARKPECRETEQAFFDRMDADTAIARCRLIDALVRMADADAAASAILRLDDAAPLVLAAGRRLGTVDAIDAYLAIARDDRASVFLAAHALRPIPPAGGACGIIAAELDDFALRLARDREPVRLFGLIFAIERARQMMFVEHPALFATPRVSGRRLSVAGTLNPGLTSRLAILMNEIGATPAHQALILAQAHTAYEVIERIARALLAVGVATAGPVEAPFPADRVAP